MSANNSLAARLYGRTVMNGECWEFTGALTKGYGRINANGRQRLAHCVSYELQVGDVPDGLQLDHTCRNRRCVNPSHLRPVTQRENILCGESPAAKNARKTHCKRGHLFDEKNTHITAKGHRKCRTCETGLQFAKRKAAGSGVNNRDKTHCSKGHPFDPANTAIRKGARYCRTCERANAKRQKLKRRLGK